MHSRIPAAAAATLLILLGSESLRAQSGESVMWPGTPSAVTYGIEVGGALNLFDQTIAHSPIDNPTSPLRTLASGSGVGGYATALARYEFSPRWSFEVRAGGELKSFTTSGSGVADCPALDSELGFDTVSMDVSMRLRALYATGGVMVHFEPVDRLGILAGVVHHRLAGEVSERIDATITTPGECLFSSTGSKSATTESESSEGFVADRWGLEAGVAYTILLSPKLELRPSARFQFMIDPLSPDGSAEVDEFRERTLGRLNVQMTDRTLHAVQIGVALLWAP